MLAPQKWAHLVEPENGPPKPPDAAAERSDSGQSAGRDRETTNGRAVVLTIIFRQR